MFPVTFITGQSCNVVGGRYCATTECEPLPKRNPRQNMTKVEQKYPFNGGVCSVDICFIFNKEMQSRSNKTDS